MSSQQPAVVALDLGSSSVRAVVLDDGLRPLAAARHPTALRQEASGAATVDADAYVDAVAQCLDELRDGHALGGVHAVAASCQWHSLVPLDANCEPIGPGLSWLDTRGTPPPGLAPEDEAAYHQRTGAWWHGLYWPPRIAWLRDQGVHAQRWTGFGEHLAFRLLGGYATSVASSSGTGALNTVTCEWDEEALQLAGLDDSQLPEVAPDDWRGRLLPQYAHRWPELADARWSLPLGDGAASAVGTGCEGPDRLGITVGTSAAVRLVCPGAPEVPHRVWRYRIDHERSVIGIAISGGGVLYDWVTGLVGDNPSDAELSILKPGQHGLVVLPFHAGHRPPLPAGATGTVHGLRLSTRPVDIVAATVEGTCHELADGAQLLGGDHAEAPVIGGGAVAASPWLSRRLAAAFGGRALRRLDPEVGALGAATLATGLVSEAALEPVEASAEEVAAMAESAERHRALRDLLAPVSSPHAADHTNASTV